MEERMAQDAELAAALGELRELKQASEIGVAFAEDSLEGAGGFHFDEVIRTA